MNLILRFEERARKMRKSSRSRRSRMERSKKVQLLKISRLQPHPQGLKKAQLRAPAPKAKKRLTIT